MLAKKVFKDSINYNNTKIVRGKLLGMPNTSNNAMTPFGNIHFPEVIYDTISDFSKGSVDDQVWYIHEMAHVWQRTMGVNVAACGIKIALTGGYHFWNAYDYSLSSQNKQAKFSQFNIEQQASMIAEYFSIHHLNHNPKKLTDREKDVLTHILRQFIYNPSNKGIITSY